MIKRQVQESIRNKLFKAKAILLFGARQTGKSTLAEILLTEEGQEWLTLNGDDADVRELLREPSAVRLKALAGNNKIILIDEAQRIENIGLAIKIITDQLKEMQVIATGSSAFELNNRLSEPLTGRKYEFRLFPLSFEEMLMHHGLLEEKRLMEHRMVFGYYPEIVTHPGEEKERLKLLASSYLFKDLLMLEQIKKPVLLEKLLKALALQVGSEVNFTELGQLTGSDRKTVEKYIDLLEKAFVLFQLPAFNRNVRNEISKGRKVYFYDCGIRNAIINNFKPLDTRTDSGALFENFIIAERIKYLNNTGAEVEHFFWRTTQQQEIDLIEISEEKMTAYEIKRKKDAQVRFPLTFTSNYPEALTKLITPGNAESLISSIEPGEL